MATSASTFDPGPYHGSKESDATVYCWIAGVISCFALLLPWVGVLYVAHHRHATLNATLTSCGYPPGLRLACIDLILLTVIFTVSGLFGSLTKRIRQGGPDADYLDRTRMTIAVAAMNGAMVALFALMPH